MWYKESISQKKRYLASYLKSPIARLADECAVTWQNPEALSGIIRNHYPEIPHCQAIYCFDPDGLQITPDVSRNNLDYRNLEADISYRPYFSDLMPYTGLVLSAVYGKEITNAPCITAVQAVRRENQLLGFLAVDFHINDLPKFIPAQDDTYAWRQYKGDPSIRNGVFNQRREPSILDSRIDEILYVIECLITNYGVFNLQIDFSASRITIWRMESPFEFNILNVDELLTPEFYDSLEPNAYTREAVISRQDVTKLLRQMKSLRYADENLYLRSALLNTITGTIGLTFSCDGFHVMSTDEFLDKDMGFWLGGCESNFYGMHLKAS